MKIEVLHFTTIMAAATAVIISDCFPFAGAGDRAQVHHGKKKWNVIDLMRFAHYLRHIAIVSGCFFFCSLRVPVRYLQLIAGWFACIGSLRGSPERWKLIHSSYYHTLKDNQWAAWCEYYANVHCVCNAHQIMTCNSLIASIIQRPHSLLPRHIHY